MATSSKTSATKSPAKPAAKAPAAKKTTSAKPTPAAAAPAKPVPAVAASAPVAVKSVVKAAVKPAPKAVADKAAKPKKPKLIRDSFTIPKNELEAIDTLKLRAARLGRPVKKSEILRAGIMALSALDDAQLVAGLARVPVLKTGRPGKEKA